jgi:spermidine synthase
VIFPPKYSTPAETVVGGQTKEKINPPAIAVSIPIFNFDAIIKLMKNFLYYFPPFLSGYIIMSLEILGFRLLAPYFGYSLYVFGALIGLILLCLAAGYFLGGFLADRGVSLQRLFQIMLFAAIYLGFIVLYYPQILERLAVLDVIAGSLTATLAMFAPQMTALAALPPYFIKLVSVHKAGAVGISAGLISAFSTLGGLIGTFLTAFYLVPVFGTKIAFISNLVLLLGLSLSVLILKNRKYAFFALLLLPVFWNYSPVSDSRTIFQTDSFYSHLKVVDFGDWLALITSDRHPLIQSYYQKDGQSDRFLFYNLFGVIPFLNDAKKILLLGLGAGSIPRVHNEFNPGVEVTGVELDGKAAAIGKKYFALDEIKNLKIVIADARPFLRQSREIYDIVEIDAFNGGGEIPFYLATREFFKLTFDRSGAAGILAMNIYDPSEDQIIFNPLMNTIASVYPYSYYIKTLLGSYLAIGSKKPIDLKLPEKISEDFSDLFKKNLQSFVLSDKNPVFTDDWAPIEKLTFQSF